MTDDKWKETTDRIKKMFTVLEEGSEELDDRPGTRVFICFMGPGDVKMRVERLQYHPVKNKKTIGSRRAGSDSQVEYEYDESETIDRLAIARWDDAREDWVEVKGEMGAAIF